MTFYQELQLNQAGSKNLLKKSETLKEKLYHMWVYLVKIAVTMAFCFFFVSIFSILFGNENSIVGVVVLLCLMVFRNCLLYTSDGYELVSERRSAGYQIPVLMITAKCSFDDMRQGFLSGSDDYIRK